MSIEALTSAEISLPARPDAGLVRARIAILATHVDLVGLTDNHAGQPRMSPLAAVALAREQGVATVVHVSCRDRNRLALRSQVVGGMGVPDRVRAREERTGLAGPGGALRWGDRRQAGGKPAPLDVQPTPPPPAAIFIEGTGAYRP